MVRNKKHAYSKFFLAPSFSFIKRCVRKLQNMILVICIIFFNCKHFKFEHVLLCNTLDLFAPFLEISTSSSVGEHYSSNYWQFWSINVTHYTGPIHISETLCSRKCASRQKHKHKFIKKLFESFRIKRLSKNCQWIFTPI